MRLYANSMSPYARKVFVVIREHGLQDRVELIDVNPRQKPDAVIPLNPLGKIPFLVTGDGLTIKDSPVIAEYLDAEFGKTRLLPASGPARWRALTRIADADGIIEAAILVRNERLRPEGEQSAEFIAWHFGKVQRCLDELERTIDPAAPEFDLGVVATACAIGYTARRLPEFEGIKHPRLAAFYARLLERPSMAATEPS